MAQLKGRWDFNWKNPISPDGKYAVTRGNGNTIQIWDLENNQVAVRPENSAKMLKVGRQVRTGTHRET
ncbi:MAG: hypothetical protein LDL41_20190 [Coleofasciculus sp. S288]|nr:hypothetical protein [Coleofasciculus sp. S288]